MRWLCACHQQQCAKVIGSRGGVVTTSGAKVPNSSGLQRAASLYSTYTKAHLSHCPTLRGEMVVELDKSGRLDGRLPLKLDRGVLTVPRHALAQHHHCFALLIGAFLRGPLHPRPLVGRRDGSPVDAPGWPNSHIPHVHNRPLAGHRRPLRAMANAAESQPANALRGAASGS
jgi:hypothetical protein